MATRIDQIFFELAVKGGPEANRLVGKFAGILRRTGVGARAAERELSRYSRGTQRAERGTASLGRSVKRMIGIFGGLFILRTIIGTIAGFETAMAEIATIAEGGTERVVRIGRHALQALLDYLEAQPLSVGRGLKVDPDAVFVSAATGQRLEATTMERIVARSIRRALHERRLGLRAIRASFIVHLPDAGADLRAVQALAGHRSVQSTARYRRLATGRLRAIYDAAHPRAKAHL